jgi:exopolysaccharide production protein ExoZ
LSTVNTLANGTHAAAPAATSARLSLTSLQYLRGVAALLVVYFHSVLQLRNFGYADTLPLFGEAGVDLFFVLSGFLMWMTTSRSATTPWSFLRKRLIRILPLYWTLTLAAAAVALLAPQLLKSTKFEGAHFIASMLFVPHLNPGIGPGVVEGMRYSPVLVPGWTLNYEMFFYLVFALCLLTRPAIRLLLVPIAFALLALAGATGQLGGGPISFYGNSIILEFVFGMGVAVLMHRGTVIGAKLAWLAGLIAAGLLLMADLNHASMRALTFGVPAAVVVYALCCAEIGSRFRELPLLKLLGDASYSIYLTHIFTLAACRVLFMRLFPGTAPNELLFVIVALCASSIVGVLTYRLYEKPAMLLLERFK